MTTTKMHANEVATDEGLVSRLIASQFPEWSALPIHRVASAGTDNAMYRLGTNMVVRMPRIEWAVKAVEIEQRWLPVLAPHLSLEVPVPFAKGQPADGYPWNWSIYRWLEGTDAAAVPPQDLNRAAIDIAAFIRALRSIDATEAPRAKRPANLATSDALTREAISGLGTKIDARRVTGVWAAALEAPEWPGSPVWIHSDLDPTNLLVRSGRLSAVIDFGSVRAGDPARDMKPAWSLFSGESRRLFRREVAADDAMWARGRGMVLAEALQNLVYYDMNTNPTIVRMAHHKIDQLISEL